MLNVLYYVLVNLFVVGFIGLLKMNFLKGVVELVDVGGVLVCFDSGEM